MNTWVLDQQSVWSLPNALGPAAYTCERGLALALGPEAFNTAANSAFQFAGLFTFWRVSGAGLDAEDRRSLIALVFLTMLTGFGGALHHTHGTALARFAAIIPAAMFGLGALVLTLRGLIGLSRVMTQLVVLALTTMMAWVVLIAHFLPCPMGKPRLNDDIWWNLACLSGGAIYLPALLTLAVLSLVLWRQKSSGRRGFALATLAAFGGFSARSFDAVACPFSTFEGVAITGHAVWHVAIAVAAASVMFGLMRGLTAAAKGAADAPAPEPVLFTFAEVPSRS